MEPNQVNVLSVDVLDALASAMIRCKEDLAAALQEADAEVDRAIVWVQHDRLPHWRKRMQRLDHDVAGARSALFRKESHRASRDSKPSTVDERKSLAHAQSSLMDADRRCKASQRWSQELLRHQAEYKRGVNLVAVMVDRELPAAIEALRRMSIALERYRREGNLDLRMLLPESKGMADADSMRRQSDPEASKGQQP